MTSPIISSPHLCKETGSSSARSAATEAGPLQPGSEPAAQARGLTEDRIVSLLDKWQARDLQRDDGHGLRSAREIGNAVGLEKAACRQLLERMAAAGLIRRVEFSNALCWRSTTPLPWEEGGKLAAERARLDALWAQPLTLIVQAVRCGRDGKVSRDVKAYPEGLRDMALAHVERENWVSETRRRDDRVNGCHLRPGYEPAPTYRLVAIAGTTDPLDSPGKPNPDESAA